MRLSLAIAFLPLLVCISGCNHGSSSGAAASASAKRTGHGKHRTKPSATSSAEVAAPAAATAAAGGPKTCKSYGAEGAGSFSEPCKVKGPAPFTMKWTGKYVESFGDKVPEFDVTSSCDHDVSWGNVSLWYYDKDGKVLEHKSKDGSVFKRYYKNGSGVLEIKPKETKKMGIGLAEKDTPKATDTIEAEVTGWGWDEEPKLFLDAHTEKDSLDDRPKGGWK